MASRHFTTIPYISPGQLPVWELRILNALKDNVDLLTGRGSAGDNDLRAVLSGQLTLKLLESQNLTNVSAVGSAYRIQGVAVADGTEFQKLITDVQTLANDLAQTRSAINALLSQLGA